MDTEKKRFTIGMRTIKTAAAVFLSLILCQLREGAVPIYAAMAGALCIQGTRSGSLLKGFDRVVDTVVGAVFGLAATGLFHSFPALTGEPWRSAIIALGVLPVISFTQLENKTRSTFFIVVVFMSVALSGNIDLAISRIIDTAIGCVVGCAVNLLWAAPADPEPTEEA